MNNPFPQVVYKCLHFQAVMLNAEPTRSTMNHSIIANFRLEQDKKNLLQTSILHWNFTLFINEGLAPLAINSRVIFFAIGF
jgi:hypothetical protein